MLTENGSSLPLFSCQMKQSSRSFPDTAPLSLLSPLPAPSPPDRPHSLAKPPPPPEASFPPRSLLSHTPRRGPSSWLPGASGPPWCRRPALCSVGLQTHSPQAASKLPPGRKLPGTAPRVPLYHLHLPAPRALCLLHQ